MKISTDASIKEMIPHGCLVMLTLLIVGFFFGVETLSGVLAGSLVSGVQVAISASNTGGAWDNAKKYIEVSNLFVCREFIFVIKNIRRERFEDCEMM